MSTGINLTCQKTYSDLPFAHRQHNHKGHCKFIHGHNWAFTFVFGAEVVDENGFVIDFGDLKWLKEWIKTRFDHTLVLNQLDPELDTLVQFLGDQFANIVVVPDASSEGLAIWLFYQVDYQIQQYTGERVYLREVTVQEDSKNSANFVRSVTNE